MGREFERAIQRPEPPLFHHTKRVRVRRAPGSRHAAGGVILLLFLCCATSGCLVVTLHPSYVDDAIVFDPSLVGSWQSEDDETVIRVTGDEWRSYRIDYAHAIEAGVLTGYLTEVGADRYMDLTPARGRDHGAFVVPVHAAVRVRVEADRLELTPLSYDSFLDAARRRSGVPGLAFVLDQKLNAVVSSPTVELRRWLTRQRAGSPLLGPTTAFRRLKAEG